MELKQTFPLIFFKLFLSLVPPCPHFVLYFLKRAKLTTCCDVSFFAVVVHCLLFCPPHLLCLFSCFLTFRPLKQNRKSLFSFPFSCIIKSLSPALFFSLSTFFFLIYLLFPLHSSTVSLADSYSGTPVRGPDETLRVLWPLFHIVATINDKPSAAMPSKVYTHMHVHARTNTCAMS